MGRLAAAVAGAGLLGPASAFVAPSGGALRGAGLPHANPADDGNAGMPQSQGTALPNVMGCVGVLGGAAAAVAVGARVSKRRATRAKGARLVPLQATVGDAVPAIGLDKGFPPEKVPLAEYCKGKKVVLVGLPGAFTPTWSNTQVPGYLAREDELKAKGVSDVLVYCVNDGAVMTAWAKDQGVEDSIITFLGDPRSELTKALDLVLDHPGPMSVLGNPRCKRFSMLIDDGVIKTVNVAATEDDPAGDDNPTVTLVEKMLEDL